MFPRNPMQHGRWKLSPAPGFNSQLSRMVRILWGRAEVLAWLSPITYLASRAESCPTDSGR